MDYCPWVITLDLNGKCRMNNNIETDHDWFELMLFWAVVTDPHWRYLTVFGIENLLRHGMHQPGVIGVLTELDWHRDMPCLTHALHDFSYIMMHIQHGAREDSAVQQFQQMFQLFGWRWPNFGTVVLVPVEVVPVLECRGGGHPGAPLGIDQSKRDPRPCRSQFTAVSIGFIQNWIARAMKHMEYLL